MDYGIGAQFYGMDGSLEGPRHTGTLALRNIATNRPDNVNTPTLRAARTDDGAELWVELDGIARLHGETRVLVTSVKLRTGGERYARANTFLGVLEGRSRATARRQDASTSACPVLRHNTPSPLGRRRPAREG